MMRCLRAIDEQQTLLANYVLQAHITLPCDMAVDNAFYSVESLSLGNDPNSTGDRLPSAGDRGDW